MYDLDPAHVAAVRAALGYVGGDASIDLPAPLPELAALHADEAMRHAIAAGVCKPPMCGGSLAPWAPLIVPARLDLPTVVVLCNALVALDENYLRERPDTPLLYRAGVRYEAEPPGHEQWLTVPWVLKRRDMGRGSDCEDLACWRVAELRVRFGEAAVPSVTARTSANSKSVYHIRVKRGPQGRGRIEDPSAALGMWTGETLAKYGETHSIVDGDRRT